ncbi:lysozyme inhibitor LprI family protein [Acidithiobacillus sp.]|uniref:lysozyme inhibitor LprI family protein n=1 Tax=Acidithiobacillus sp. TaxID=1872118 RepID=UPI00261EDB37|nr:lysozyme inhibitor LprI family protein [Acidithiobacillus sp.]MDD5279737.1 lysozyme inhibitor LprI family protein [Acidithiobacillus sp.]
MVDAHKIKMIKIILPLFVVTTLLFCNDSLASMSPHLAPLHCRFNDGGFPVYSQKICGRRLIKNDNQSELDYCAYAEYRKANKKLNSIYDLLMSSGHHPYLLKAELSWLKYRDNYCRMEIHQVCGGSMEPMVKYGCLAKLTKQQTANIMSSYWYFFGKNTIKSSTNSIHNNNHQKSQSWNETYALNDKVSLSQGETGWVTGCLTINKQSKDLQSSIYFSWTGHLLSTGKVKYKKYKNLLRFRFNDVGWGNVGSGVIHIHNGYVIEKLILLKKGKYGSFDADEYGTYHLKSGKCEIK